MEMSYSGKDKKGGRKEGGREGRREEYVPPIMAHVQGSLGGFKVLEHRQGGEEGRREGGREEGRGTYHPHGHRPGFARWLQSA